MAVLISPVPIPSGSGVTCGFTVTGIRKQVSEPRRLDAESNPSLNGEGSTIRRTGSVLAYSQARQAPRPDLRTPSVKLRIWA